MNRVSLEDAKSYSNIYFSEKDAEVEMLVAAAEEHVAKFLNRTSLSDADLLLSPDSPPADSPGSEQLKPGVKILVLQAFDDMYQNHGIMVVGSIVQENPAWMRAAHLYRINLGV